jgi:hypothetical protein
MNPPSARRLAAAAPPLIPTLQALFQANLALALFAADILRCSLHGSNPDREELVGQVCVMSGLMGQTTARCTPMNTVTGHVIAFRCVHEVLAPPRLHIVMDDTTYESKRNSYYNSTAPFLSTVLGVEDSWSCDTVCRRCSCRSLKQLLALLEQPT